MARRKSKQDNGLDSLITVGLEALATAVYAGFRAWWDHHDQPTQKRSNIIDAEEYFSAKQTESKAKRTQRRPTPWWKVLGVSERSSQDEITAAYRSLMAKTHPDKLAHLSEKLRKAAEREAKKLNAAYDQAKNR